jgi:hypothetical protein
LCPEGEARVFNTPTNIAYGANGVFIYKNNIQGRVVFSNSTFGYDPTPKVAKAGFYKTTLIASPTPTYNQDPALGTPTAPTPAPTTTSSKTTLYIGIGAGVLSLIAVAYFIMKKH